MKTNSKNNDKDKIIKENLQKVIESVQNIVESGEYERFLKFRNNFRNYSFNNLALIYAQFPEATRVAGRKKWSQMNRTVINGQIPIKIIAPIPKVGIKKVKIKEDGEEKIIEEQYNFYWYTTAYIYDISQTEGLEMPLENKHIDGDNMLPFFEKLKNYSMWPILEKKLENGLDGYYNKDKEIIVLNSNLSVNEKTSVLLHELSHALYDDFDYKENRELSEVFVESIAFIVADYFGLDTSKCSFNYIAGWAKGESKVILEMGNKIQKCANKFIEQLEKAIIQKIDIAA